ncbi:MAG TPA: response regulator transcription factor [Candidatus Sulfopaludibacter sp.]|nr:response regulator transcription factor [Candidatus Sulfopaludibacter sp.]
MIRVLIAAASPVTRVGLETLIASSPGMELAGGFSDLSAVETLHPAVVLSALPMAEIPPPLNGYAPVYVLLGGESPTGWTQEAVRMGVRALLPRDASAEQILAAVEAAASGMLVAEPREFEGLLPSYTASETAVLTARELEVLHMMAEGAANKQIAWKLGISDHTVKFHVASILGKLNAGTRTEAVTVGIRKGLILI